MVKKTISIVLIPLVLLCSAGFSVYVEHCPMGKSFFSLSDKKSCCCKQAMHNKCCNRTKIVLKKTNESFSSSAAENISNTESSPIVLPVFQNKFGCENYFSRDVYSSNHAPPENSIPLSILYRSLLI